MSSSVSSILLNPFQLEELRNELSQTSRFNSLKATYTSSHQVIENTNKSHLWDKLNHEVYQSLNERSNPMAYHRLQIVSKLINYGSVLDVGFGSGALEKLLQIKNIDLMGLDFSKESFKLAKKEFPNWSFKTTDLTRDWNLNNKKFDFIVCLEVMEHVSPDKTFYIFAQMYKYLKAGGKLIVSVPLNEGLEEMIKHGENPNAHVRIYTPNLIKAELQIAGFKLLKTYELYAFGQYYKLKSIITKLFLKKIKNPNTIIVIAQKP